MSLDLPYGVKAVDFGLDNNTHGVVKTDKPLAHAESCPKQINTTNPLLSRSY